MREQLGFDGEDSIPAPAAVRDGSHGRANRKMRPNIHVCSGSKCEELGFTKLSRKEVSQAVEGCPLWSVADWLLATPDGANDR